MSAKENLCNLFISCHEHASLAYKEPGAVQALCARVIDWLSQSSDAAHAKTIICPVSSSPIAWASVSLLGPVVSVFGLSSLRASVYRNANRTGAHLRERAAARLWVVWETEPGPCEMNVAPEFSLRAEKARSNLNRIMVCRDEVRPVTSRPWEFTTSSPERNE